MGVEPEKYLMEALRTLPKLTGADVEIVFRDLYETNYGICNHVNPTIRRPMASVAMHPSEEINEGSLLQDTIRKFIKTDIKEYTGLSLVEFLELPRDIVEIIVRECESHSRTKDATIHDIEKQFNSAGKH